jgi:ribosome-associated protein
MIEVTPSIRINESEIEYDFIRALALEARNVNKVASSVHCILTSAIRPPWRQASKAPDQVAGSRVTEDGILIIEAKRFRAQEQNREDALERLKHLIQRASEPEKPRRQTKPSAVARAERVAEKKRRSRLKKSRSISPQDLD